MKKILMFLITILCLNSNIQAKDYDIDFFTIILSNKYKKTVILDAEVVKLLKVYGDSIEKMDLKVLDTILVENGYKIFNINDFIYIKNKVSEEEKINQQNHIEPKETTQSTIIKIPYSKDKVKEICESVNLKCVYLSDYNYFVSYLSSFDISTFSKFQIAKTSDLAFVEVNIYELNIQDLEDKQFDINGAFTYILNNSFMPLNLMGSLVSAASSYSSSNAISITMLFKFLEEKGYSKSIATASFPLINDNQIKYSLGDTQSVKTSSTTSLENSYSTDSFKEVSSGFNIDFTVNIFDKDYILNLKMEDKGQAILDKENNTYKIPNAKTLESKFLFNDKITQYYIPFSQISNSHTNSDNKLFSFFGSNSKNDTTKKIIISFKLVKKEQTQDLLLDFLK